MARTECESGAGPGIFPGHSTRSFTVSTNLENLARRRQFWDSAPPLRFTSFPVYTKPPALNWVERFAEEHLDQEHRSLNLKVLSSSFSIARCLIIDWKQELAFLWQSRCIELKLGSCWHIRNCNRCGLENIDEHLAPATSM